MTLALFGVCFILSPSNVVPPDHAMQRTRGTASSCFAGTVSARR